MTEERIKKLLKKRYEGEALGAFLAVFFIGLIFSIFGGPGLIIWGVAVGIIFYIKVKIDNHDFVKDIGNSLLFIIYPDKNVLIKVMDEIIDHPIFKANGTNISKHFILYGDQYENIIRLYDVNGINITKLNNVYSSISVEDRFGQKKKIKVETPKAEEIYKYLSENCVNAVIDSPIEFDENSSQIRYIDYDSKLTEEYCFYEGKSKKEKKKINKVIEDKKIETRKEFKEKKEITKEVKPKEKVKPKEEVKKEVKKKNSPKPKKESSNIDKKYNDLKKLKELLDADIITKEEYEKEKNKILSN